MSSFDNLPPGMYVDKLFIQSNSNTRDLDNVVLININENGGLSIDQAATGEPIMTIDKTSGVSSANTTCSNISASNIDCNYLTTTMANVTGDLSANSVAVTGAVTADSTALTSALTANSAIVPTITASNTSTSNAIVNGLLTATTATVTGELNTNSASVTGAITAASTALTGALTANSAIVPTITASNTSTSNVTVTEFLTATNASITNDLTVGGNLIINGSTTTIDTQSLLIEDNIIVVNKNQTGTPASLLQSGIEVERGDQPNYLFVFDEATDLFKVGMSSSLQAVMTRDDTFSSGYAFFDATQSKLINRAFQNSDFNDSIITTRLIVDSNVTSAKIGGNTIVSANIAPSAVGTTQLANSSVDSTKIAASAVGSTQLANSSVDSTKIAASAVGSNQLANSSVDSTKIAASAVGTTQLANSSVDSTKIAASAVGTTQLAANAVDNTKIAASAVGSNQLANDAVTTLKILNANITQPKLAVDAVATTNIINSAVTTLKLADNNVTLLKMAQNSVGSNQIVDSNVQARHLSLPIYHGTRHTPSYISSTETAYPPIGLGGLTVTVTGQAYGNGTYVNICASQFANPVNFWKPSWYAFDNNTSTYTVSFFPDYNGWTGLYFGSLKKRYIDTNGDVQIAKGEYHGLKFPVSIKPTACYITSPIDTTLYPVREFVYIASKDGNVWYEMARSTVNSWTPGETKSFAVSSPHANDVYNYHMIVPLSIITPNNGGSHVVSFGEIKFRGYEYTPSPGDGIVSHLVPAPVQSNLALGNVENPWETLNMKKFVQIPESITYNFPPSNATSSSFTLSSQSYGNGDYTLSASSVAGGTNLYAVLNDSMGEQWTSASVYNLDGSYAGATQTQASGTTYSGEWIQLKLPYSIQITSYQMKAPVNSGLVKYTTQSWVVLGSTDGTTWTLIDDQQVNTWSSTPNQTFYAVNTKKYQYYRIVCLRSGSDTAGPIPVCIGYLKLMETLPRYRKVGLGTMTPSNALLDVIGDVFVSGMLKGPSDLRLKADLVRIDGALDKIDQLNGYTFLRTDLADGRRRTGLIAQEVERVLPEVVDRDPTTGHLSMSYAEMMGLVVEGIKELKELYTDLRNTIQK